MRKGKPAGNVLLAASLLAIILGQTGLAQDQATEVRLIVNHADCRGPGATLFNLSIDGVPVGSFPSSVGCRCNNEPLIVPLNDAQTLSAVGPAGCTEAEVSYDDPGHNMHIGFIRVEIDRTQSGTETLCLVDFQSGGSCGDRNLCNGLSNPGSSVFSSGLADRDGDGDPDCTDPDLDGDGRNNNVDNCPHSQCRPGGSRW